MRRLPLYPPNVASVVETTEPRAYDKGCSLCKLHDGPKNVCIRPRVGGAKEGPLLLVVDENPRGLDDDRGHGFSTDSGQWIMSNVEEKWGGRVVYTHAVRCAPARSTSNGYKDDEIAACRPYAAALVQQLKPERILLLGKNASQSILGRSPTHDYVRTGYSYLNYGGVAYFMPDPVRAMLNPLHARDWQADLARALRADLPPKPPTGAVVQIVETPEDAEAACASLHRNGSVAYDIEFSGGLYTEYFQVDCLAIAATGTAEVYVWSDKALNSPKCVKPLKNLLEDDSIEKVAHNGKTEAKGCQYDKRLQFKPPAVMNDPLVKRKIGFPDIRADLEYAAELVGMGGLKDEMEEALKPQIEVINQTRLEWENDEQHLPGTLPRVLEACIQYPSMNPRAFVYGMVDADLRDVYCARDAVSTGLVRNRVEEDLTEPGLQRVAQEMTRVPRAVTHIESNGLLVDRTQIMLVSQHVEQELLKLSRKLAADGLAEPSKTDQVIAYLYGRHKLPIMGYTKTDKPSVDANTLAKLPKDHPAVQLYTSWKSLDTIRSRYAMGLLDHIRADGRIHPFFNANGTETGRWSSSEPNAQNIPSRGPLAKMIKSIFIARPGYTLIQLDYSQLEYRIAALLSGDKTWTEAFKKGLDLHRRNAELASFAWGIPREVAEGMTDEEIKPYRYKAKAVGFGVLYGKAVFTLAKDWGVPESEAQAVVDAIMGQSKELAEWIEQQHRFVYANGYVNTYIDGEPARWRPLYGISSPKRQDVGGAVRCSVNSPIQGTAADYMMRSLVEIIEWLEEDLIPAYVVATVHDSVIIEVRNDFVAEVARGAKTIMESWWCGDVPLKADLEVGKSWGALRKARFNGDVLEVELVVGQDPQTGKDIRQWVTWKPGV